MRKVFLPFVQKQHTNQRFGWGCRASNVAKYAPMAREVGAGWYYDWWVNDAPLVGMEYVQLINVRPTGGTRPLTTYTDVARKRPGSLWLLGNEPDVTTQNPMLPEEYAYVYNLLRGVLLDADPSARTAPAAVSQFTPARRVYLDRVLAEYERRFHEPLPVDVWNIHGYALPEESGGVGLPMGVNGPPSYVGDWSVHTDPDIFQTQLLGFREWLTRNGYGDKQFILSEFGILDSRVNGPEVRRYMADTVTWLMESGLVQRWAWYVLSAEYQNPHGWLVDDAGLTDTGRLYAEMARG